MGLALQGMGSLRRVGRGVKSQGGRWAWGRRWGGAEGSGGRCGACLEEWGVGISLGCVRVGASVVSLRAHPALQIWCLRGGVSGLVHEVVQAHTVTDVIGLNL